MGLINSGMTIIDFDETYFAQTKLQHYPHERLDFRHLEHVNLFCEEESLQTLQMRLQKRRQKGITLIGSGNYHYLTYLLLKEISEPFTLVLFDNHPDLGTGQEVDQMLSCGSWVSYALSKIPLLQQVVIIGPTVALAQNSTHCSRTVFFPFDGTHYYSLKLILSSIPTKHVYISIDKDVLRKSEVQTNWDQGIMGIDTLNHMLETLLMSKQAEAVDICGELPLSPIEAIQPDYQSIIQKNEKANLLLLQTCLKASENQTKGA
ncbi:arginase family protein [Bacillus oleivorans]|uniref:Arginase family protein n=1 Tax=Bacillus oleivorans TaxID=1448271 RepID=A0A285CT34_9BACI|nr:arginase family protein [Bacillus oleivorans]SNX70740.1 arginase family protein [Bacillus oleivorans]